MLGYGAAISHYEKSVALQDTLPYTEPPFWYYPTRQSLGQALLLAERYADAEAIYRQDLQHYPRNGWSLNGLAQALLKQGKSAAASAVKSRFDTVWQFSDIKLQGSRL